MIGFGHDQEHIDSQQRASCPNDHTADWRTVTGERRVGRGADRAVVAGVGP